jgi:thioredoxin-like negative regulator of GroEL
MSNENRIEKLLLQSETKLVVVVFISAWSGGAHILKDKLEGVLRDGYDFHLILFNLAEEPEMAAQMNVSSVPTTILMRNHEMVDRFTGVYSLGKLLKIMKPYLSQ